MIAIRRAEERGHFGQGWADTYHTFSFGRYRDPEHTGFRKLVALNDERVRPGFEMPHRVDSDVEVLSYVLEGALEERDASGGSTLLRAGALRRFRAEEGEVQSEVNPSAEEPLRFLQFWLQPAKNGRASSSSEQRAFPLEERRGKLRLLASRGAREGSLDLETDADVYASVLDQGDLVRHPLVRARHAWIQVAKGTVEINGRLLTEGDGAAASGETELAIRALSDAEVLLFDLA